MELFLRSRIVGFSSIQLRHCWEAKFIGQSFQSTRIAGTGNQTNTLSSDNIVDCTKRLVRDLEHLANFVSVLSNKPSKWLNHYVDSDERRMACGVERYI